ncbi:predicted protein [Histoplasma capsulatum var. duboisii H88]|uniref:Predicted protein n=1 Tax=Ajellomyces capsulatus (strain H88) TaxID=544711 RepID=F0UKZ4_AJEC8|nr:predicted protein [Histoplasma capsulatum var. duboisii H88]
MSHLFVVNHELAPKESWAKYAASYHAEGYLICAGGIFLGKSRGTHVERRENHRRETIGSTPDIRGTRKLYLVYIIIGKKEHRGGFNKMQRTNSRIQANLLAGSFLIFSVNDNGEHVFAPWMAEYGAGVISTRTIQHLQISCKESDAVLVLKIAQKL